MKKCAAVIVIGVAVFALSVPMYAQNTGATKATAEVATAMVLFPNTTNTSSSSASTAAFSSFSTTGFAFAANTSSSSLATAWTPILTASFKPPGGKDLFITFSGISGLMTTATDATQNNAFVNNAGFTSSSTSSATAESGAGAAATANLRIEVRVLIDSSPTDTSSPPATGSVADPGVIVLDNLMRLIGLDTGLTLSGSAAINAFASQSITVDQSALLQLALAEGGARSFTFIKRSVGVGMHTITVQARYAANNIAGTSASAFAGAFTNGSSFSSTGTSGVAASTSQIGAVLGPRTLSVEEVMLN